MKLIYIAGPYRPYTNAYGALVDTTQNISHAEITAVHLVDTLGHLGLFPVVPHLNTRDFENQVKKNDDQYFLDGTMATATFGSMARSFSPVTHSFGFSV